MKRHVFIAVILGLLLTLNASAARGSMLSFDPPNSTVAVGDSFGVNLVISGLDPSLGLGAYAFKVNYDPGILNAIGVTFGSSLGNPNSIAGYDLTSPGIISISEVSLLSTTDLLSLQPVTFFTLATLSFHASAAGFSPLTLTFSFAEDWNGLGDAAGFDIGDYTTGAGQVTVNTVVPVPASLWLLGSGVIVLIRLRKKATRDAQ
jgi:hypothetical protein